MTEASLEANYAGVFSTKLGFGERPVVLVIDFVRAYTEPGSPLYAPSAPAAATATARVVAAARSANVPVIYTRVVHSKGGLDAGRWREKIPAIADLFIETPLNEIVADLTPAPDDVVIIKSYASCFFGTSLAATLAAAGADTLILTGVSTSGCVRATAVDGLQNGFRVMVPRPCVADRHEAPHEANLFDINAKYGDVVEEAEVVEYLRGRNTR